MNTHICNAIRNRQVLRLRYNGGDRMVEPHRYGCGSNGEEVLSAYQTAGYSERGQPQGWKLFKIQQIESLPYAFGFLPTLQGQGQHE